MASSTLGENKKVIPANLVFELNVDDGEEPTTPILTAPPMMLSPINSTSSSITRSETRQGSLSSLLEKIEKNPSLTKVSSLKSVLSGSGSILMKTNASIEKYGTEDQSFGLTGISSPLLRPNLSEPEATGLLQKLGSRSASFREEDCEMSKVENQEAKLMLRYNEENKEKEKTESSPPTPPLKNGHPLLMSCEGKASYASFSINAMPEINDIATTDNAIPSEVISGETKETPSGENALEEENIQSYNELEPNENKEVRGSLCNELIDTKNSNEEVKVDQNGIPSTVTEMAESGSSDKISNDETMEDNELEGSQVNLSTDDTSSSEKDEDIHYDADADADTDHLEEDYDQMDCHDDTDKSQNKEVEEEISEEKMDTEARHVPAPEILTTPLHVGPPPIEIVFSFDTTGSMSSYLDSLKLQLEHIIQRLFADIPNLKVGIIAHGDYCDRDMYYLLQSLDFSNDFNSLCDFIKNAKGTGGGDWEECYEWALRHTREKFSWTPGSQRSLVMIGDAIPHPKNDPQNTLAIDWQEEVKKLYTEMGVSIYAVQCEDLMSSNADYFWEDMATMTNGKHLKLNQFDDIVDLMMAICYRERGAEFYEAYEKEVRTREGPAIRHELGNLLEALGKSPEKKPTSSRKADPNLPSTSDVVTPPSVSPTTSKTDSIAKVSPKRKNVKAVIIRRRPTPKKPSRKSRRLSGPTTRSMASPQAGVSGLTMSPKKIKRIAQNKTRKVETEKKSPRVLRESVDDRRFAASNLHWGRWYLAMSPEKPVVDSKHYTPMDDGGFVRSLLFLRDSDYIFEIAVSGRIPGKMVPLFIAAVHGISNKWYDYLLSSKQVKKQVNNIISQGSSIFIRQAVNTSTPIVLGGKTCRNISDIKTHLVRQYDYAWCSHGRKTPRDLTKKFRGSTIQLSVSFQ